jgi:hypothetical protein
MPITRIRRRWKVAHMHDHCRTPNRWTVVFHGNALRSFTPGCRSGKSYLRLESDFDIHSRQQSWPEKQVPGSSRLFHLKKAANTFSENALQRDWQAARSERCICVLDNQRSACSPCYDLPPLQGRQG